MNWYYKNEIVDENFPLPENAVGFVYKISRYINEGMANDAYRNSPYTLNLNLPDRIYIGKKSLIQTHKKKVGKREQARQLLETGDKRKVKRVTRVKKASPWMKYESSCSPLKLEIKEHPELFRKEIICFCFSKKELSYRELQQQFRYNVLETDSFNDNIAGTYYRRDLIKPNNDNSKETDRIIDPII